MQPLEITLKTLTPLWTGGIEAGKMDRIHETGIIGSLRWWYEAIVRGLGGRACDPSTHSCVYDPEKPHNGLCDVCQLFGATGWRRQFSLRVTSNMAPSWNDNHPINIRPYGRNRDWYLPPGQVGTTTISLTGDLRTRQELKATLLFMGKYGNYGARPQLGYGRFQIIDIKNDPGSHNWKVIGEAKPGELPDLRTFTFFNLQFQPRHNDWWRQISGVRQLPQDRQNLVANLVAQHQTVPTTPALKNYLRFGLESDWSSEIAHWLFGTLRGNQRLRSKVGLSWAYYQQDRWQIDGWIYLPQDKPGKANQQNIKQQLQQALMLPQNWLSGIGLKSDYNYQAKTNVMPAIYPWETHTASQIAHFLNQQNQGDA
ncbi:MAG: type III-B CRISPR module RAMP protein Cmr1 [Candidatus Promineifilaceae bacterium]